MFQLVLGEYDQLQWAVHKLTLAIQINYHWCKLVLLVKIKTFGAIRETVTTSPVRPKPYSLIVKENVT